MLGSSPSSSSSSKTSPYSLRTLVSTSSSSISLAMLKAVEGLDETKCSGFWQSTHVQPGPHTLPLRTQPHLLFVQEFFLQEQPLRSSCTWSLTCCIFVGESHSTSKLSLVVLHPYSVTSSRWYSAWLHVSATQHDRSQCRQSAKRRMRKSAYSFIVEWVPRGVTLIRNIPSSTTVFGFHPEGMLLRIMRFSSHLVV